MDECIYFDFLLISVESGSLAIILPEGMKFINKEVSGRSQRPRCFRKNKGQVPDMFQHEIADDQIK